jgi:hypothetical protein
MIVQLLVTGSCSLKGKMCNALTDTQLLTFDKFTTSLSCLPVHTSCKNVCMRVHADMFIVGFVYGAALK